MPVSAAEGPNKLFIRQIQSSGGTHYTPDPHTIQTESSKHPNYMYISGLPNCGCKQKRNEMFDTFMKIILADRLTKSKLKLQKPKLYELLLKISTT